MFLYAGHARGSVVPAGASRVRRQSRQTSCAEHQLHGVAAMLIQAEQGLPAVEFGKGRMHESDCFAAQAMGGRDTGLIQGRQSLVSSFHQREDQELLPGDMPEESRASHAARCGDGAEQALVECAGKVFGSAGASAPELLDGAGI